MELTHLILLLILSVGLIVPELFRTLRRPSVTLLILMGAFGLAVIPDNETIQFSGRLCRV